jgi:hypothetical protein
MTKLTPQENANATTATKSKKPKAALTSPASNASGAARVTVASRRVPKNNPFHEA